ncbi:MAG TPA: Fe-S protein assembly co-chaperone HscB [Candidatus Binataceae bacterium]|jgi:molecular chaperone HscB|nr:Fe-S protein assembly co-chaperone HscB [Candidatus Binataceae bacterium]
MTQAQCPSCARLQEPRLICSDCGAPLAAELDYFAALGVPRRLILDPSQLETLYHDLGRRVHPDRFANSPAQIRAVSLTATALLTRAFRTLRDPVGRALYWLELHGEKLASDNKKVAPELAELIFEVQETLSELRDADFNGGDEKEILRAQIAASKQGIDASLKEALAELELNFTRWDSGVNHDPGLIVQLKAILSRIAYLRTLARDIDCALDQHYLR